MAVPRIGILLDAVDLGGCPVTQGFAELCPSQPLADPADGAAVFSDPVTGQLGDPFGVAFVIPTDAAGPQPAGWTLHVEFRNAPGAPLPGNFFVPAGPCAFTVAEGDPGVFTWTPTGAFSAAGLVPLPAGTCVTLAGEGLPPEFSTGVTYWVTSSSGATFQLASEAGGAPLAASAAGAGAFTVARYRLSALIPVEPVEPMGAYAQLGGDLGGVPAQVTAIQGTPVEPPPGDASEYLDGTGHWSAPAGAAGAVVSVNGQTGPVVLTAADVGADAAGSATSALSMAEAYADTSKLAKSADLADLSSAPAARGNLGLGSAAVQPASAFDAAGAAAAAQATAETYAATQASAAQAASLQKSANLSDLSSASTARANLGLGSAATQAAGAFDAAGAAAAAQSAAEAASDPSGSAASAQSAAENYADTNKLAKSANLSDLGSAVTARANLGLGTAAVQPSSAFDTAGAAAAAQAAAEAASLSLTGGTMAGPIAMGGNKVTGAANGVASTDFATVGQLPSVPSLPLSISNGGTGAATAPQNDVFAGPAAGGTGAPSYRALVAADLPAATTSAQGAVVIDGTASDIQPNGIQAAGTTGKAADAGHAHQENAMQSLYMAPAGATAETFSRIYAYTVAYPAVTSGTLYLRAIPIPKGVTVSNLTFMTGSAAEAGGSHGWYCLLDSGLVVRAVTADQTAAAKWGATFTPYTLPVSSAYTTTYGGLFYIGVCITATTMPAFLAGAGTQSSLTNLAPILMGSSSTGQSTPPAAGTTMGALAGSAAFDFYAYTS